MSDLWKNLTGIIGNLFQIGGKSGPKIKNNAGVFEFRNAADNAPARARVAAPLADLDVVNKLYADSLEKPLIVKRQADCSGAIPNNTAVRGFVVVSTAGSGAAIGDVLYDNGSNSGLMEILAAVDGRCLAVRAALVGGTSTFEVDSIYIWDEDAVAWEKIGDIGAVTGAVRLIRFTLDNTATQDSTDKLPAASRVLKSRLQIVTPYDGGTTISLGQAGAVSAFMTTAQNDPVGALTGDAFEVDQDTAVDAGALALRATVAGAPSAGAALASVWYSNPND